MPPTEPTTEPKPDPSKRVQIRLSRLSASALQRLADAQGQPFGTVCSQLLEDFVLSDDYDKLLQKIENLRNKK